MPPYMERKTRLELATPTLARWCSTTELLPHLWCSGTELNRRHGDFQSPALPTELPEQLATPIRFELTIFAVTGRHVKPLHHGAVSPLFQHGVPQRKLFYHDLSFLASLFLSFFPVIQKFPLCYRPRLMYNIAGTLCLHRFYKEFYREDRTNTWFMQ